MLSRRKRTRRRGPLSFRCNGSESDLANIVFLMCEDIPSKDTYCDSVHGTSSSCPESSSEELAHGSRSPRDSRRLTKNGGKRIQFLVGASLLGCGPNSRSTQRTTDQYDFNSSCDYGCGLPSSTSKDLNVMLNNLLILDGDA